MSNKPNIHQNHLLQLVKAETGERTEAVVLTLVELADYLSELKPEDAEADAMVIVIGEIDEENKIKWVNIPLMYAQNFVDLVNRDLAKDQQTEEA